MKIQDMKISTRLHLALGVILALVVILAWEALTQNRALWMQTSIMYDHPLAVRSAVGAFKSHVTAMHRDMRGLILEAGSDQMIFSLLAQIEVSKTDAYRQLDILKTRYLGPAEDIKTLYIEFVKWNAIREETIRLLRQGMIQKAADRTKPDGIGGIQARLLYEKMDKVDEFSRNMSDHVYREAASLNDRLHQRFYLFAGTILLFVLFIAFVLVRWVKEPLQRVTDAADRFRQGDLTARSSYAFTNEFGLMSTAFNAMADTVAAEIHLRDKVGRLAAATFRETDLRSFCRELLAVMVDQTGSQIGAVYLLNPNQAVFELFESIGLGAGGRARFSAEAGEGEFGAALAMGQVQHITAIPDDTAYTFATVSGEFRTREIITIPLLANNRVTAVISLASIRPYDAVAVRLVNDSVTIIAARMEGAVLFQDIKDIAQQLKAQNQEMEAFTYTVSHDLRAPLRHISGYVDLLNKRFPDALPEKAGHYLNEIKDSALQMGCLIDDLLQFSRTGRQDLRRENMDMNAAVQETLEKLKVDTKDRNITWTIAELPRVFGDYSLLKQVWMNLLDNAVKYTQTKDEAEIEVGFTREADQWEFFVRDNGVGFDMQYVHKLFGVFQRLHSPAQFEGTGIGLANVQRIIHRHGGRVRAEGQPEKGATFYFTIPKNIFDEGGRS